MPMQYLDDLNGATNTPMLKEPPKEDSLAQYDKFKKLAEGLIKGWKDGVRPSLTNNRLARKAQADVTEMQASGKIGANHTFVGIRLIDSNINAEMPPHIMYLKQSKRIGVFQPQDARLARDASFSAEYVEAEFARVMTYPEWEAAFVKMLDASSLHGFSPMEVMFDISKPGHVCVEYVSPFDLIWDRRCDSIQSSRMILRAHRITIVDLNRLAQKHGLDAASVTKLQEKLTEQEGDSSTHDARVTVQDEVTIYRAFFKNDVGEVQEAWYACDGETFLKEPAPFYNGIKTREVNMQVATDAMQVEPSVTYVDEPQTLYPYFIKMMRLTENSKIVEAEGRGAMDYYKQDSASATLSAFLNGCTDASNTMWAPSDKDPGKSGSEPKTISMQLKNGAVWDTPMTPFRAPYPDAMMLTAVNTIQTLNQVETSNIAFAVNNRKDSRKTATENQLAQQQSTALSGVQVLMFSLTLTAILNYAWKIVQSEALQEQIMFCPDAQGKNAVAIIEKSYLIKPAGDVDFIERGERVQKMQQDWPVIQATPLKDVFLQDYIMARYPERAEKYLATLQSAQQTTQLLTSVSQLLQQAVTDENGQLTPEWQPHAQQLQQLAMQVQQVIGAQQQPQQQPQQQAEG